MAIVYFNIDIILKETKHALIREVMMTCLLQVCCCPLLCMCMCICMKYVVRNSAKKKKFSKDKLCFTGCGTHKCSWQQRAGGAVVVGMSGQESSSSLCVVYNCSISLSDYF